MKPPATLLSRSIQGMTIRGGIFIPDVIKAIKDEFSFVRYPTTPEEILSPARPLIFEHGKASIDGLPYTIQGLSIFPEAVMVDVTSTTSVASAIIHELLMWGRRHRLLLTSDASPRIYASQLEVEFETPVARVFSMLDEISGLVTKNLRSYQEQESGLDCEVTAIGIAPDLSKFTIPCDFRIERRTNVPFEANLYFCQAPLKTEDHIAALEAFERMAAGA